MPLPKWIARASPAKLTSALNGRFDVLSTVGAGGQAAMFKAVGTVGSNKGVSVALKLYDPAGSQARIDFEVRAMKAIRVPYLARALDQGTLKLGSNSARWVAWEFIEGESLRTRLKAGRKLTSPETARLGIDIASAIETLWSRRIVHRDIKPDNVMCQATTGTFVLVDLGIARHLGEASITQPGSACGTPGYMSPEQAFGERRLTSHSDVFSLGVTLVEALDGRHPTGGNQAGLMLPSPNLVSRLKTVIPWALPLGMMLKYDVVSRSTPQDVRVALAPFK